ncbi:nucleotidyltransferase family protein [Jannaschia donghaensis]|uniref:Molybdopterin-guanine dinucleotide biosynthesis protein MobA n=1 Tax=Jannaschia donghaensis TaxID=420998 RepID=A0A0M6YLU6_9RHOB|nr:nucleotidyltransferase family protein [Jannaschia donghaensis]CTQ50615.1 molybdopterin-guanine dinucleotide biosynthesis protein MobA [Jannaschia donghaensis]
MRSPPAILILAAGASTRMRGSDKLLEEVDGTPLILRATRAALGVADQVIVALPPASHRRAWLGDTAATLVEVGDRAMSASIRAGVAACTADALLIHLADMPEIDATALATVSSAWMAGHAPVLRATDADGAPGQPVVFDRNLFAELTDLAGDTGARDVIARHGVDTCALIGRAATTDLDTPEAWAAWRAANPSR